MTRANSNKYSEFLKSTAKNVDDGITPANEVADHGEARQNTGESHNTRKMREAAEAYKKNKGKESLVVVDLRKKKKNAVQQNKVRAINPAAVIAFSNVPEQGNGDV